MTDKRLTIYQLEMKARQRYPDESWTWHRRYAKMVSRVIGWEKNYSGFEVSHGLDVVLLFVNEEDHTTRSPAKKRAIEDWRDTRVQAEAPTLIRGFEVDIDEIQPEVFDSRGGGA